MLKSDDRSVTPFFLPNISYKNAVNRSVLFDFDNSFFIIQFCVFFPVNEMHIQHGKKFIELIARNTVETKQDT